MDFKLKYGVLYKIAIVTAGVIAAASAYYPDYPNNLNAPIGQTIEKTIAYDGKDSLAGSYLAGRFAQHQQDWESAQLFIDDVVKLDANNDTLEQKELLLSIGSSNFEKANQIAEKFIGTDNEVSELAHIFLASREIKNGNYEKALTYINGMKETGFGQYTKPLLSVWAYVGEGKMDKARAILLENSTENDPIYNIHAGLIDEISGNDKGALSHYKLAMANGLELHTAIIIANYFNRTGKANVANEIYANLDKVYPYKPFTRAAKIGAAINIKTPAEGAALAMYDLTSILYNNKAYDSAKIYGHIVQMLDPKSDFTKIMMGDISALYNRHSEAIEIYSSIAADSPVFWLAKTRISEVYEIEGSIDKSAQILNEMATDANIRTEVMASLGDLYRRNNNFEDAVKAYDNALSNVKDVTDDYWKIIYARGIAKEKVTAWDNAEKDLLAALKMQPQNAHILNFIAYSWAEKGINLEQALIFAKQAATINPFDGAILDSYGWIEFRLGHYDESVKILEKAVDLLPNDSEVLDHLGDAYWKNGSYSEAKQLWRRAANYTKDENFRSVALEKVELGIITADELTSEHASLKQ